MADYVLIQVEGVLADPDPENFAASESILDGRLLFYGLSQFYKVALFHSQDEAKADHWLQVAGIRGETVRYRVPSCVEALRTMRADHGDVSFAVVATPIDARRLLREGCATLTFTRPTYVRGEWRPDHDTLLRTWDDVVRELEEQAKLREADLRVSADIDRRWE